MDWGKQDVREATAKKSLYANRTRTAFHKPLSEGAGLYWVIPILKLFSENTTNVTFTRPLWPDNDSGSPLLRMIAA